MTHASVIIPARDAAATISATLDAIARQSFAGAFEVIVVDDGSRDATVALAKSSPVVTRVIELEGTGPSAARNAGVAAATTDRLAFIDSDCAPSENWLRAGIAALDSVDYVQGMTRPDPGEHVGPFDRSLWVVAPSPLYESANMFMRRDVFQRLGGFEPWLVPRSGKELGEDVWLGWRARRAGVRMAFCREAEATHAVFRRSPAEYVAERARLRFFPAMARRIPELRREFFWARVFHSPRSAAFDAAAAGLVVAIAARRPLALVAGLPYAAMLRASGYGGSTRHVAKVALVGVTADAVGAVALLVGSARYRSPLF